ncbi:hypothetical protein BD779DRAFT_575434 [Infundibulicybe gibba]|nr:hypothetical protein BD779DRAFT_575434 [Infundibulicybe gibba]
MPLCSGACYPVTCWVATPRSQPWTPAPMSSNNIAPSFGTPRPLRSGSTQPQTQTQVPNTPLHSGTGYPTTNWTPQTPFPHSQPQVQPPSSQTQPPPQAASGIPAWFYLNPCVPSPAVVHSPGLHVPPSQRTPWTPGGSGLYTGQLLPPMTPAQGPAPMVPPTTTLPPSFVATVTPVAPLTSYPYVSPPNITVDPPTPPTPAPGGMGSTSCPGCGRDPARPLCGCCPCTPNPTLLTPAMNAAGLPTPPRTPVGGRRSPPRGPIVQPTPLANPTHTQLGGGSASLANAGQTPSASPANLIHPYTPAGGNTAQPIPPAMTISDPSSRCLDHQLRLGINWDVTTHPENAMFICPKYGPAELHPGAAAIHPECTEIEVCAADEALAPWFQNWGNITVRHGTRGPVTVKQVLKAMHNYFRQSLTLEEIAKLPPATSARGDGRPRRRAEVLNGLVVLAEMWDATPPGQTVPLLMFRLST